MLFNLPTALTSRLPASLALCATLSACATPIVTNLDALPCVEMVEASGLLSPTPGAPLPLSDKVGEIASFADRQTGQLDKANADKRGARQIMLTCDQYQRRALDEARRRNTPWYRRIF